MRIFVTGGTGFIGSRLVERLAGAGHEILVLSRAGGPRTGAPEGAAFIPGDPLRPGPWQEEAASCEAAVNLAGASLSRRWTKRWKKAILESRIATTRNLVDAYLARPGASRVLVSASAVGYYGPRGDEPLDESSPPGQGFLAEVTRAWEHEAARAEAAGVRVVRARFGVVLGKGGGALEKWSRVFRGFLGGRLGSGRQWLSWVHVDDAIEAIGALLRDPGARGAYNVCAPGPVRNTEMIRALGRAFHRPSLLVVPGFAARLVLGELASTLLTGQRVLPTRLLARGFPFRHPEIEEALGEIVGKGG